MRDVTALDDNGLEEALRKAPAIADAGFSAGVAVRVAALRRRRRWVLTLSAVLAALTCAMITPWALVLQWMLDLGGIAAAMTAAALHWSLSPLAWGALIAGAAAAPMLLTADGAGRE
ncbi:MAG: hypothetical protein D6782_05120 [Alphaproteobacteria bacterium]|nr:MAG: hypothetical protein D6782_05120 [Alphaproteobacteria bacterium]